MDSMKLSEEVHEWGEVEQNRSKALIAAVALSISALTSWCAVDYIRTRPYYLDRGGVYYPDRSYHHHHQEQPKVIIIQQKAPPPPPPRKVIIIDNSRGWHGWHQHNNHWRNR